MVKRISWQRDDVEIVRKIKSKFDFLSISSLRRRFERLPSLIKWIIAVIVGGFIYKTSEILISSQVSQFQGIEQLSTAVQIQFAFDIVLIVIIIILIATMIKHGDFE